MDPRRNYDEESLQHMHALLQKHDIETIFRMALEVTQSRPTSVITSTSRFSHNSSGSRYSGLSTDYAPSLQSSASSHSRSRREAPLFRSGMNTTKTTLTLVSSPVSEVFSPPDALSLPSPVPQDLETRSIASPAAQQNATSAGGGPWFCTFCSKVTTFSEKADWKKHETRIHETGEDWPCPIRNCGEVLDRKLDFEAHFKRNHPEVPCPTDVRIRLLPRVVYGCGFDGCKAVLTGWKDRCDHVASHMKPKGTEKRKTRADWSYSNMIQNLLRQEATRAAWKSLFADFGSKESRNKMTWTPENTRVLKQKLECCDMRPEVDVVLHTALSLRSDRPFNDVPELDPDFKTPSQDSVLYFNTLTDEQLAFTISGRCPRPAFHVPASYVIDPKTDLNEPHPGELVAFEVPSPTISGRRISYMDVDIEDLGPSDDGPDPQIPPGLELDPSQLQSAGSPKPFQIWYSHSQAVDDTSSQPRRASRGHILTRHFKGRKG